MQLENATALFVVEVYCSGAKSKVVLRSELSSAAEWTHYGLRTRYSQILLCVKSHYGSCLCTPRYYRQQLPSKKTNILMKKKKIAIGVTDTFGRVPGAQFYVPLRTARLSKPLPGFLFISI